MKRKNTPKQITSKPHHRYNHPLTHRRADGTYYDNDVNRKAVRRRGKEFIDSQLDEMTDGYDLDELNNDQDYK